MRIEVICTGDEVLTGKIVNTNFSYITQKLEDVGLGVRWGTTNGDDRETLLAAFLHAAERADAVIVNGGLGPTVDDLSQEVAAEATIPAPSKWLSSITPPTVPSLMSMFSAVVSAMLLPMIVS